MLIPIRYSGSHCHAAPEYTWYHAMVMMHGLGDLILVTKFWSRLWGWIIGEFSFFT
jgi:hypothetical protein